MCTLLALVCALATVVRAGLEYPCTYTSAAGLFYDLSPLSSCSGVGYADPDDTGITLNICNSLATTGGCMAGSVACQGDQFSLGAVSMGSFSDLPNGVKLIYAGGDVSMSCPSPGSRSVVYNFMCDNSYPDPYINFLSESPLCTFNFEIKSKHACPVTPGPQIQMCEINVFLVPHTHDDVGWLMTIDEYYDTQVRSIISTTVADLDANPNHTFIYVEQAYFWRWWNDGNITDAQRTAFRRVYDRGQFEFVIGGWTMQDEACTTYGADINQLTLGHQFILNEFGAIPTKGWQLDPFGASSVTPTLYRLAGFDAHLIDRVTNKEYYEQTQTLQFLWQGSPSLGQSTQIFSEIMNGQSNAYCDWFLAFDFRSNPVNASNVQSYAALFYSMVEQHRANVLTNNVLAAWGCDFQFQNATAMFLSMDYLVDYMRQLENQTGIKVKYTNLSDYFSAVTSSDVAWPTNFGGDFFPLYEYNIYWTGYFTSRTVLKGLVRQGEAIASASEQIFSAGCQYTKVDPVATSEQLFTLRLANADATHHDGVTGTSLPPVVQMYENDLVNGMKNALESSASFLSSFATLGEDPNLFTSSLDAILNIQAGQTISVLLYNSLGWARRDMAAIPVNSEAFSVTNYSGDPVATQVNPNFLGNAQGKFNLYFPTFVLAYGYSVYFITLNSSNPERSKTFVSDAPEISNDLISVNFSTTSGISTIYNKKSQLTLPVNQNIYRYTSQKSGCYGFQPTGPAAAFSSLPPKTVVTVGNLVSKVFQIFPDELNFNSWAKQNVRVFHSDSEVDVGIFTEISFDLGPLPPFTEVITQFNTPLATEMEFFTDDNGFEYQKRTSTYPVEPIEANHYPTIYAAGIQDDNNQLTVISERSHSCASLASGEFEVMLHRNPNMTDDLVPFFLTDTDEAFPVLRLIVDTVNASVIYARRQPYFLNFPLLSFFSASKASPNYTMSHSFLSGELPPNVHLLTVKRLEYNSSRTILRFTHLFAVGEDPVYSAPVTIDLGQLFPSLTSLEETTLTANKVIPNTNPEILTLTPKQIRTFVATFN